ncbi:hypothetical protein [Rheinheimera sp. SA_1]|uniref:hypothetical protein n=1 Tax=Rheinheimera sp. SA_1 TaxID=1827365 RepID=UPI0012F7278E|nr:hypothetical protein [Rheinheimera sp. SA_1]
MDEFSETIGNKFRSQFPQWLEYRGEVDHKGTVIKFTVSREAENRNQKVRHSGPKTLTSSLIRVRRYLLYGTELMKTFCLFFLILFSISVHADAVAVSASSFNKLKTLVGEWKKEGSDGENFYISFEITAKGSVLIENWINKGVSHSLTLYHLDGDKLLATHYCPQGNQPRLKLDHNLKGNALSFVFQDATNLESQQKNHQHSLAFEFIDTNTISREESYSQAGTVTASTMRLVRR